MLPPEQLRGRWGFVVRLLSRVCASVSKCKDVSSQAAMKTATTGSSSAKGESVGALTRTEGK